MADTSQESRGPGVQVAPRRMPRRLRGLVASPAALGGVALAVYLLAALAIFGRGVVGSPDSKIVGDAGADKTIFMWAFRWWPHSVVHGHDPFNANVVWVPHGIDLSWVTSVPLLSFVLSPLTAAFGEVVAYNVAVLAAPALSAWAAYLLARWLTKSFWPSLLGGWLFGFSAFEIGHMVGHLNLVYLVFVPLCALLTLRHLHCEITDRRFVVLLALALAGQFLTSTEVFVTLLLVAALFIGSLALFEPSIRGRLRRTVICSALGTLFCLVLVSPYLWHAFIVSGTKNAPLRSPYSASADVLNYLVPTRLIELQLPGSSEIASHFTAIGAERGAYLGLPLLLIVALFLATVRRSRTRMAVAVALALTIVASLGASVRVLGHGLVPAPWKVLAVLPITRTILPIRLTLFVALAVAMIAAVWVTESGGGSARWRWLLAVLAVLFVLPNPATKQWSADVPNPAFFRTSEYRTYIGYGETALVLPYGGAGWSLLWQAEDGFQYRLVGGHLGRKVTPEEARWKSIYLALGPGPSSGNFGPSFRRFLATHNVDVIVVARDTRLRAQRLVDSLGLTPVHAADVAVYRLH